MSPVPKTLVLARSEKSKADGAMVARVLIVIPQAVHILVPPGAVRNTACEGFQSSLGLTFDFPSLRLGHPESGKVKFGSGHIGWEGRTTTLSQDGVDFRHLLCRCKGTRTVGNVVLEAIRLLV